MGTATDSWPALIIEQAVANDWCTKTICTTRGAHDFRRAVWAEAAVQIGRSFALQRGEWPNRKLLGLPNGERQALIDAVVTGLVGLPRDFRCDQAVRTVLNASGTPFRSDWSNRHWSGRKPVKYSGASDSTRPIRPFVDGHTQ
jgi:hypothetical protein